MSSDEDRPQYGRGRQFRLYHDDDSSSSRDASPHARARPALDLRDKSPEIVDEPGIMPSVPAEPAEETHRSPAPILRQPLAFGASISTSSSQVQTYTAAPAPKTNKRVYLPGQRPVIKRPKRKRLNEEFADQTTRWKVDQYVNDRSAAAGAQPSIALPKAGPYSADFRAGAEVVEPSPSPILNLTTAKARKPRANKAKMPQIPGVSVGRVSSSPYIQPDGHYRVHTYADHGVEGSQSPRSPASAQSSENSSNMIARRKKPQAAFSDLTVEQSLAVMDRYGRVVGPGPALTPTPSTTTPAHATSPPLRILTLLIEDVRRGESDDQLAEVHVPLRPSLNDAGEPEGFWADAMDVSSKLQNSPSRIEGAAKVYTFRGKYRQFFLQTFPDGGYNSTPVNLRVNSDRTIEVIVDWPELSESSKAGSHFVSPTPQPQPQPHTQTRSRSQPVPGTQVRPLIETTPSPQSQEKEKLLSQPDFEAESQEVSSSMPLAERPPIIPSTPFLTTAAVPSTVRKRRASWSSVSSNSSYDYSDVTPESQSDESMEKVIVEALRPALRTFREQFENDRNPLSVPTIVRLFREIDHTIKRSLPKYTPSALVGAPNKKIKKVHVVKALNKSNEWEEDRMETVALLKFYGSSGDRLVDQRVQALLNEVEPASALETTQDQISAFLALLRQVDREWRARHADEAQKADEAIAQSRERRQERLRKRQNRKRVKTC